MKSSEAARLGATSLVLAVFFVFCSFSTRIGAAEFCLPEADTPVPGTQSPANVSNDLKTNGYGFFDANPNMRGFLSNEAAGDGASASYRDLMLALPYALAEVSGDVHYHKVAETTSPMDPTTIPLILANPEFYKCQKSTALSECNRTKTHIDQLLAAAAALPTSSFFVLASDLSIDGNLLLDNKAGSIKSSLETILQSDRAVGIIGIKMPFAGTIFSLPSGRSYMEAQSRPVFLLAIGARDKVIRFHDLLKEGLGDRLTIENHNFLIFTNQLFHKSLIGDDWPNNAFKAGKGVHVDKLWDQANGFQQFTMLKNNEGASAKINLTDIQTPQSLPIQGFKVENHLWQWRKVSSACENRWMKLDRKKKMIEITRKGEQFVFKLGGPASVVRNLPKRRKYFVRTEVTAIDIGLDKSLSSWVWDWSFDSSSEDDFFNSQASFFPALNLRRFVNQLEDVTRSTFKPKIIARFDLGVYLDR